ncbi:sugar O-acetyltransferase [Shewanella sp. WXL01]|uniref:Nodulation protein L n=1 Tax=Shewanella maritima TaxID=2520507 RepID=A0A411PMF0_9GAMM|nr:MULTISPECIES: sugar O-acetyltransferase [Shewanella]NKF52561.1 sugar O-acetyltransferase [Shewanella sp. WXL01]QBF84679.1 sugar O-acetyltransferase [Shewanella maritima]
MTEYEKMKQGYDFDAGDKEICQVRANALTLTTKINHCGDSEVVQQLAKDLLGQIGNNSFITAPFKCEFGKNIIIGSNSFINMGCTILDGAEVRIGDNVLIAPSVQLYSASHSLDYKARRGWKTFCKPIVIEDDVWIGGNVVINQGVTIGARSVVAASSVVNQDVPADTVVGGVPAKVIKKLNQ